MNPCMPRRRGVEAWAGDVSSWSWQGFHRYSTDQHWHVPHFEKMLYDQGQLAAAYSRAFQVRPQHPSAQGLAWHAGRWLGRAGLAWGAVSKPVPQGVAHPMGMERSHARLHLLVFTQERCTNP